MPAPTSRSSGCKITQPFSAQNCCKARISPWNVERSLAALTVFELLRISRGCNYPRLSLTIPPSPAIWASQLSMPGWNCDNVAPQNTTTRLIKSQRYPIPQLLSHPRISVAALAAATISLTRGGRHLGPVVVPVSDQGQGHNQQKPAALLSR